MIVAIALTRFHQNPALGFELRLQRTALLHPQTTAFQHLDLVPQCHHIRMVLVVSHSFSCVLVLQLPYGFAVRVGLDLLQLTLKERLILLQRADLLSDVAHFLLGPILRRHIGLRRLRQVIDMFLLEISQLGFQPRYLNAVTFRFGLDEGSGRRFSIVTKLATDKDELIGQHLRNLLCVLGRFAVVGDLETRIDILLVTRLRIEDFFLDHVQVKSLAEFDQRGFRLVLQLRVKTELLASRLQIRFAEDRIFELGDILVDVIIAIPLVRRSL